PVRPGGPSDAGPERGQQDRGHPDRRGRLRRPAVRTRLHRQGHPVGDLNPPQKELRMSTPRWSSPPAMEIDPARTYRATMETSHGTIQIDLFAAEAPVTV